MLSYWPEKINKQNFKEDIQIDKECTIKIQNMNKIDESTKINYKLNNISLLPHIETQLPDYWLKLEQKYPKNTNYFYSKERILELKVLHTLKNDVEIIFDTTFPEKTLYNFLHSITDRLGMNIIPNANIPIGKPEYRGKIYNYMKHHNTIILLINSLQDQSQQLDPFYTRHFITITKIGNNDKYVIFNSGGQFKIDRTLEHIINFIGGSFQKIKIENDNYHKSINVAKEYVNLLNQTIRIKLDYIHPDDIEIQHDHAKQDIIKKERDSDPLYIQYSKLLKNHNNEKRSPVQFFLKNTNIIPIEMSFQQRQTSFFWSILRALHPEKTQDESICMLNAAVIKSGINNIPTIHKNDYFDLVLIHIFETLINTNKQIIKSETEIDEYRSYL
jgi:hypothetical protein